MDGYNSLTGVNQPNSGAVFVILKEWHEREGPELQAEALVARFQAEVSWMIRGQGDGLSAPADPGAGDDRRGRDFLGWGGPPEGSPSW